MKPIDAITYVEFGWVKVIHTFVWDSVGPNWYRTKRFDYFKLDLSKIKINGPICKSILDEEYDFD